ncbi:MAG: DNA polymerase [Planctomycetota bacterium]|nr:MAG: DNA polymerase [Planctomycetota bacterium]
MNTPLPDDAFALHLAGGTSDQLRRLRRTLGGHRRWLSRGRIAWCRVGLPEPLSRRVEEFARAERLSLERERVARAGAQLVGLLGPDLPAQLGALHRPPVALVVRGRWPPPEGALGIVGARAVTPAGRAAASRFGEAAGRHGRAVVSGLARGVDSAALEGCLRAGGWPVAVLGNGLDVAYPPENASLQEDIARQGTLVSEFPMRTRPDRWTFPRRNRILAALCEALLVVEASARSGALITAQHALELGVEVWTVPGPIDSAACAGSNELLFDGAAPVLSEAVLLRLLGADASPAARNRPPADPVEAALATGPRSADELAAELALPLPRLRARLIAMELEGNVKRESAGRWSWRHA